MYARLVATLDPCAPDLAPELMQQLKGEFRFRVGIVLFEDMHRIGCEVVLNPGV